MPRTHHSATYHPVTKVLAAFALGAIAVAGTACGTAAARPGTGASALAPNSPGAAAAGDVTRSGSHMLSATDFGRVSDAPNAFVAIERLRPLFLRPRPSFGSLRGRPPVVSVFVNGSYAGSVDALRLITPDVVASARFLQPTEAITTLGARHAADGVIMVQLKGFRR